MTTLADWARGGESDVWLDLGKIDGNKGETVKRLPPSVWSREPFYVAGEVKRQLKRFRLVPAIPASDYKRWAKGETRKPPVTFYDGTIDRKRLRYAG